MYFIPTIGFLTSFLKRVVASIIKIEMQKMKVYPYNCCIAESNASIGMIEFICSKCMFVKFVNPCWYMASPIGEAIPVRTNPNMQRT